jgi:[phosphatase 2A protein]-leucine-carboxy methyltransferase
MSFHGDESGVIATNDDASESKRSCVKLNYYKDDYIANFVKISEKKAPEINRGYYARVKGIEMCIERFLQVSWHCELHLTLKIFSLNSLSHSQLQRTGGKCQIINLGCGFDTLYWRLRDVGHMVENFIELDYPTVTAKKCYQIKRSKVLLEKLNIEGDTRYTGAKFP